VAGRMNWDRARNETTLRDREEQPSGLGSGRPSRKLASPDTQGAAIARYKDEFARLRLRPSWPTSPLATSRS